MSSTAADRLTGIIAALPTVVQGVGAIVDSLATGLRGLASQIAHQDQPVTDAQLNTMADQLEAVRDALITSVVTGTTAEHELGLLPAGGNDTIVGGQGDDTLLSGAGDDTISGDVSTDTLIGAAGDDTIHASEPTTILGGTGDDTIAATEGAETMAGGSGDDVIHPDEPTPEAA